MRLVSTKQTLQNSEFFKRFRDGRFEGKLLHSQFLEESPILTLPLVQLCKYSVDLLVSFLLSNNLSFALSVLNDKISIVERGSLMPPPHASCLTTSEGLPREAQEAYAGSRIVTGYSKVEVLHINTKPVRWGVPKELRSLYEETCAAKKAIPVPKTSKERIRLKRAQEQQVESCPPTNTEFFSTLCKFVVEPLRSGNLKLGAEVPTDEDAGSGNGKSIPKGGRDTGGSASAPNKSIPASSDAKKSSTSESVSHGKARKAESKSSSRASSAKKLPGWPSIGFHTFYNSHNSLTCAEASVDSSVVVAGFDDSKLRLWQHLNVGFNLEAERNISATLEDERIREDCRRHSEDLVSHSGPVYGCSISRDSRSILSCSADGLVKLWIYLPPSSRQSDTGSTETKHSNKKLWFNVHNFRPRSYATPVPIWDVKFSPVGYYFATASHDNVARLWDVEHNGSLRDFQGHISDVDCLTWHPNCHYIATGSSDKTVRLWDINKAQCCRLFTGHVSGVSSVTIDHTGRYLVSAETSGLIFVWDLVAGKRIKILQGHRSPVWSLSCSPDGRFVGSGSADTTIRIWETSHIWGKNSGTRDTIDSTSQAKKHGFLANQAVRTFRTKFTGVSFLRFQNERFVLACGNFSLPLMS